MVRNRNVLLILALIFSLLMMSSCSNESDLSADEVVENFLINLFNKDKKALDYTTGAVKKNVYNNFNSLEKREIKGIENVSELEGDRVSIVHSTVEYVDDNGINVAFYRFKLINTDNGYLIYKIEKNEPLLTSAKDSNVKSKDEEMFGVINKYYKAVENNDLKSAASLLIGKAKSNHLLTYKYLSDLLSQLDDFAFSDMEYEKMLLNGKIALVINTYKIRNKQVQMMITLYLTQQGWMIYDIEEI